MFERTWEVEHIVTVNIIDNLLRTVVHVNIEWLS